MSTLAAAEILANPHAFNPQATYVYAYADAETSLTVGYQSADAVRDIMARVCAQHEGVTGEYVRNGVIFRSADRSIVWSFTLAD